MSRLRCCGMKMRRLAALVDILVDRASQKGTGMDCQTAAALSCTVTGIAERRHSPFPIRFVAQRAAAAQTLPGHAEELTKVTPIAPPLLKTFAALSTPRRWWPIRKGFELIRAAAGEYGCGRQLGEMARFGGLAASSRPLPRSHHRGLHARRRAPLLLADEFFVDASTTPSQPGAAL